jgi:hypothetical protein
VVAPVRQGGRHRAGMVAHQRRHQHVPGVAAALARRGASRARPTSGALASRKEMTPPSLRRRRPTGSGWSRTSGAFGWVHGRCG